MKLHAGNRARIILDTDLGSDCDDAGAIAVLHALAGMGEAEILACIYSSEKNRFGAGCLSAINHYYRRDDIPIGASAEHEVGDPRNDFLEAIARDQERFGHPVVSREDVSDLVSVYRRALAHSPDQSVRIVSIGHTKGPFSLLKSGECSASPLNGRQLVEQKVKEWIAMGGEFPVEKNPGWNFGRNGSARYSKQVVEEWPTPIVFCGYEVGKTILTGRSLQSTPDDNPVREAYKRWENALHDQRPSWDQAAVLFAVRGLASYWKLARGKCRIDGDGRTSWEDQHDGPHAYLVRRVPSEHLSEVIGELMALPPKRGGGLKRRQGDP